MAFDAPDPYAEAVRGGIGLTYTVDASLGGVPVPGATGLCPTGGSITDTTKPGVRRVLNLELAGDHDMYDRLAPIGTVLKPYAHVTYTNRLSVAIPMGVFSIDTETLSEGGGKLSLTAPDRWVLIQRSKFIGPATSTPGIKVTDMIVVLIQTALGAGEPVNVTATSNATVGALTWPEDREKAINDLAAGIGAWVFCDRFGVFTVADVPTIGKSADWLVDAGASGVLLTLDRSKSRTSTANVVLVESTASAGESFPVQFLFDNDPTSPTYAGTNPVTNPGSAGPFGIVVYPYSTSLPLSIPQAQRLGQSILAKTVGLASQANFTQLHNPAMDSFDVIDVLPPGRSSVTVPGSPEIYPGEDVFPSDSLFLGQPAKTYRTGTSPAMERHVADTVTHPLDVSQPMQVAGRSTRSDPYT